MKKLFYGVCIAFLMSGSLFALEFQTTSKFYNDEHSYRCYIPVYPNYKLVIGGSSVITTRSDQVNMTLLLGVNKNVPLLNNVDIYFLNGLDTDETAVGKRKYKTYSVNMSKKWLYSINQNIQVGLEAVLGQLNLQGEADRIYILPNVYPILSINVNF